MMQFNVHAFKLSRNGQQVKKLIKQQVIEVFGNKYISLQYCLIIHCEFAWTIR